MTRDQGKSFTTVLELIVSVRFPPLQRIQLANKKINVDVLFENTLLTKPFFI